MNNPYVSLEDSDGLGDSGRGSVLHTPVNRRVITVALALASVNAYFSFLHGGNRMAALFVVAIALGLTLYNAAFGFTGSWRVLVVDGRGAGLRAQMAMLAIATAFFLPLLSQGSVFGQMLSGSIAPVGVSVVLGAFMFGIGMQFGGSCASGTLLAAAGGGTRGLITLFFFVAGSLLGSLHLPWWLDRSGLEGVSLLSELGLWGAMAFQGDLFSAIALLTVIIEKRRHGTLERRVLRNAMGWRRVVLGPWSLLAGAATLALLNVATLLLAGHPWNISFGYTLWGAKIAEVAGLDVANWPFWTWPYPAQALQGSVFAEPTSVMNFGIIMGALLAAGMAGNVAPCAPSR